MIYIASPYSHPRAVIRNARYAKVSAYTTHLLCKGMVAYSPIVHCHHLVKNYTLPTDINFWRRFDIGMIRLAEELHVLTISGWKVSEGLDFEIDFAKSLYIPIKYVKEEEWLGSSTPVNSHSKPS